MICCETLRTLRVCRLLTKSGASSLKEIPFQGKQLHYWIFWRLRLLTWGQLTDSSLNSLFTKPQQSVRQQRSFTNCIGYTIWCTWEPLCACSPNRSPSTVPHFDMPLFPVHIRCVNKWNGPHMGVVQHIFWHVLYSPREILVGLWNIVWNWECFKYTWTASAMFITVQSKSTRLQLPFYWGLLEE